MSVPEAWGIPHLATASAVRNEAWFPGGIVTVFRLRQRGDIIVVRLFRFIVLRAGLLRQQRVDRPFDLNPNARKPSIWPIRLPRPSLSLFIA